MSYLENRTWMIGDELIGVQIVPALKNGAERFRLRQVDLIGANLSAEYLVGRLGPGWSEGDDDPDLSAADSLQGDRHVVIVRSIPADQALAQIHQNVGLHTPLSRTPI
jgi:hypothetical protein